MEPTRGEWLVRQMERRGVGVRQLADALDVTTQTVYGWQNSKTVINEDRVPRLAGVLGVSVLAARRGLGFWVPPESTGEPDPAGDLEGVRTLLLEALARLDELEQEREIS